MASFRNHRTTEITCDGGMCDEFIMQKGDWQDVWNSAQADGWTSKQVSGVWFHYCPECSKPFAGKFDPRKL